MRFPQSTLCIASCLLLLAACGKAADTIQVGDGTGQVLEIQKVHVVMNNGKAITDPVHGKEKGFWYGAIAGVGGTISTGVSYTYAFADGAFLHTLNLNITLLPKGKYYVGWLDDGVDGKPVRMGTLANLFGDVRYSLRFETNQDITNDTHVFVTQETTKDPQTPGTKIAEGTVKRYDRAQ